MSRLRWRDAAPGGKNASATGGAPEDILANPKWPMLRHAALPVRVRIPLVGVRLRDVRSLQVGATIESVWPASEEVPLYAGDVALSWCEFEGADQRMAVRITRLG